MDGKRNSKIKKGSTPLAELHACSTPILKAQPIGSLLQTWNNSVPTLYKYPSSQLEIIYETKSGKILKKKHSPVETNLTSRSFMNCEDPLSGKSKNLEVQVINEVKSKELLLSMPIPDPGIVTKCFISDQESVTDFQAQCEISGVTSNFNVLPTEDADTDNETNNSCSKCAALESELENVKDCLKSSEQLVETLEQENNNLRSDMINLVVNLKRNQKQNIYLAKHLIELKKTISNSVDKEKWIIEETGLLSKRDELPFDRLHESFNRINSKLNSFNCSISRTDS